MPDPYACSVDSECKLRGIDEWETCSHVKQPAGEYQNQISQDVASMSQQGYICLCLVEEQKCGYTLPASVP